MLCETSPSISFWSGALTAIVAALLTHVFAAWRESQNRKHAVRAAKERRKAEFLGVLGGMRAEAERIVRDAYAERFPGRLFELRREAAKLESDLTDDKRAAFNEKVTALCRLTNSEVSEAERDNYIGRTRVTEAIDAIVRSLD